MKNQNICRSYFGGRYGRRKPLVQKAVLNLGLDFFFFFNFDLNFSVSKNVILTTSNIGHCFNIRHFSYPDPNTRELWRNGVSSGL